MIHGRESWAAALPTRAMAEHAITRVTVHHTAIDPSEPTPAHLRSIQTFHQGERGWPDIAYHLFVAADGSAWEGRNLLFAGDSATDYDLSGHAHVALLGNFEHREPPAAQLAGGLDVVLWLVERYGLDPARIGAHRDFADTACPGACLYPHVVAWARR